VQSSSDRAHKAELRTGSVRSRHACTRSLRDFPMLLVHLQD
jgi:hypothetical protein